MTKSRFSRGLILVTLALLFLPSMARADAGIPMLPIAYPVVLLFLVPIVAIEAIYLRLRLRTPWGQTVKAASIINVITLVLGYPLAWVIDLLFEILLGILAVGLDKIGLRGAVDRIAWVGYMFPAWLGPTEQLWPLYIAFIVLLVPSFLLSGFVESRMVAHYGMLETLHAKPDADPITLAIPDSESTSAATRIRSALWMANVLSYLFLAGAGVLTLYLKFRHR